MAPVTANGLARRVRRARSNFYIAMRLMPAQRREAMFAIYAFARVLDDVADGPQSRAEKHQALQTWRAELDAIYRGAPTTSIGNALTGAVRRYDLPRAEFDALIDGMVMDIDADMNAPSLTELDLYCRRVAGSIGLLALHVFGCETQAEQDFAVNLGRALQLTNIARDVAEDGGRGRVYVPREILSAASIAEVDPLRLISHPNFTDVRTRLWPALAMMGIYRRILRKIAAAPRDTERVQIPPHIQLRIALRAMVLARP
jgi:presqualene diphosphate synthase